jgi:hypothetical protein
MARYLNFLCWSQRAKNFFPTAAGQCFELEKLLTDIDFRVASQLTDLLDLLLKLHKGFFEVQQSTTGHDASAE